MVHSVGLKKILVGDVAEGVSAMPAAMTALGRTYKGTADFSSEEGTVTDFFCEEEEEPFDSVVSQKGATTFKFCVTEWDNASLTKIFGGTTKTENATIDGKAYTGLAKYVAPSDLVQKEFSVRVISKNGVVVDIPRAKVTAKFKWNMAMTEVSQIDISCKVLSATASGPYAIYTLPA
jgi:hypothetical protein